MLFFHPPTEPPQELTVSQVRENMRETFDAARGGKDFRVCRHKVLHAAIISPRSFESLNRCRRGIEQGFDSAIRRVTKLRRPDGVTGTAWSDLLEQMKSLLVELQSAGVIDVSPDRVVATSGGGVDTYFFSADRDDQGRPIRYACLSVDDDGDASVIFYDEGRISGEDLLPGSDAASLSEKLSSFLLGDEPGSSS